MKALYTIFNAIKSGVRLEVRQLSMLVLEHTMEFHKDWSMADEAFLKHKVEIPEALMKRYLDYWDAKDRLDFMNEYQEAELTATEATFVFDQHHETLFKIGRTAR